MCISVQLIELNSSFWLQPLQRGHLSMLRHLYDDERPWLFLQNFRDEMLQPCYQHGLPGHDLGDLVG